MTFSLKLALIVLISPSRPEIEFSKLIASEEWRLSNVNKSYEVCPTYSSVLVVPKVITDEQLIQSAGFRDEGRFPIPSYRHENGAVLLKSSQPNPMTTKRCRADEAILNSLLSKSQRGVIVDTWGGGKNPSKWSSENEQHYSQWKKIVRPIGTPSLSPQAMIEQTLSLNRFRKL
jgi:myotubularin-related protein 9